MNEETHSESTEVDSLLSILDTKLGEDITNDFADEENDESSYNNDGVGDEPREGTDEQGKDATDDASKQGEESEDKSTDESKKAEDGQDDKKVNETPKQTRAERRAESISKDIVSLLAEKKELMKQIVSENVPQFQQLPTVADLVGVYDASKGEYIGGQVDVNGNRYTVETAKQEISRINSSNAQTAAEHMKVMEDVAEKQFDSKVVAQSILDNYPFLDSTSDEKDEVAIEIFDNYVKSKTLVFKDKEGNIKYTYFDNPKEIIEIADILAKKFAPKAEDKPVVNKQQDSGIPAPSQTKKKEEVSDPTLAMLDSMLG